jgi:hypothetical protein
VERFERDGAALLPLPAAPPEACEKITTRVTSLSLVRYRSNDYFVPTQYGHRAGAGEGLCTSCGNRLWQRSDRPHERCYERESAVP